MIAAFAAAPTSLIMMAAVLGVVAGLLIAFGPLSFLAGPVDRINESLVAGGYGAFDKLLGALGPEVASHPAVSVLQVVLSTAMPGIIAVILVVAAKAAVKIRRLVSAVLLVAAFTSFLYLPIGDAITLSATALVLAALLALGTGVLITLPLITLATLIGVRYGVLLWQGSLPAIGRGALELSTFSKGEALNMWRGVLILVGLMPFAYAVKAAFSDEKSKK